MELFELTAHEIRDKIRNKQVKAREILDACTKRIGALDPKVHAFLVLMKDQACAKADKVDQQVSKGEALGPLAGVPWGIKDVLCTYGVETTCSSKILKGFLPPYDAHVVQKLGQAGMIGLGKTNMDEFAMGSSTENSAFGPTKNPWDLMRIPGGSSGGSAAAVAAQFCPVALGSDTGGSIRQPASLCGIVGMKPTYGRVSRYGLIAFASSLDQIGPFGRDVRDCALVLQQIAGHDPKDSTSAPLAVPDYEKALVPDIKGWRIGVPKEYFVAGMDKEVEEAVKKALKHLESLGAIVVEVSLPHTSYCLDTYYIIAPSEASSNLARFDGVQYGFRSKEMENLNEMYMQTRAQGFGPEVKRRIMIGTYALSAGYYDAYYLKALKVRTLIKQDFDKAFEKCDVIMTPTSPTCAFKLNEKMDDPLQMYLSDIFTISVNLAGLPGISLPCGFNKDNLPIGLQIIGKPFEEEKILRAAYTYEQSTEWHKKKASI